MKVGDFVLPKIGAKHCSTWANVGGRPVLVEKDEIVSFWKQGGIVTEVLPVMGETLVTIESGETSSLLFEHQLEVVERQRFQGTSMI